ncbi:unnamed protein product [Rotaria sordida]|uniref:Uncharacterized protein n=1 Tax=Rotaria sordida TaxID=392033 RepID=A0A814C2V6_9BILA|nr:unnamed protein product [Rotaria sordida]CAF0941805.1 unnamed protein product [Rotaria sordida]CAF3995807.1 unnamed protein product [Rotaria sordida]
MNEKETRTNDDGHIENGLNYYLKQKWKLFVTLFGLFGFMTMGISYGLIDLVSNILITNVWSSRSTEPLNCIYFGYPVGALLSIIIVRSFRQNDPFIDRNYIKYSNSTIIIKENYFQSELVGTYIITSIFCLISSIGFALVAHKQNQYKKKEKLEKLITSQSSIKEEINIQSKSKKSKFWKLCSPTTCGQGYFAYGFILISLILLFNFFCAGIEKGFTEFFISFVEQEQINPNKKDSAYSMIFYWLPMLIGRIFSAFLTILFIWYFGLNRISLFLLVTANGLSISPISATLIALFLQRFHSKRENKHQTNEAIHQEDNTLETFLRHDQYD